MGLMAEFSVEWFGDARRRDPGRGCGASTRYEVDKRRSPVQSGSMSTLLSPHDTASDLEGTAFRHGTGALHASFSTRDFTAAVRLLDQVAEVADAMNHHPDVTVGYGKISFQLSSHDVGGVTSRDLKLARRIQELAGAAGAADADAAGATDAGGS
jgi:4a-hydroxytetrahydrobiopterin dehydratase